MTSEAIHGASRQDEKASVGCVVKGLVAAAVLLFATGSANAQTGSPVEGGLQAKAEKVEGALLAKPETADAQAPAAAATPDGFKVGGFTFKPGGRIKLDIIRDFNPVGNEDAFDPRTIPTDGSEGGNSNIHARETRLFLDMRGPVEGRELKMFIETDFYGSGNSLRLRHGYASWGGLLAGQTWSTFMDDANIPNTIDFETPIAAPLIRQAQLRWTQKVAANVAWAVAVEDNKSAITPPVSIPGKAEYPLPDLVTSVRYTGSRGHAFGSFFLGKARFHPVQGELPGHRS